MTPATRTMYALADRLGVMVCDLKKKMPLKEYFEWLEYCEYVSEQFENKPAEPTETTDAELLRAFNVHH